jgi:hypothetical protein
MFSCLRVLCFSGPSSCLSQCREQCSASTFCSLYVIEACSASQYWLTTHIADKATSYSFCAFFSQSHALEFPFFGNTAARLCMTSCVWTGGHACRLQNIAYLRERPNQRISSSYSLKDLWLYSDRVSCDASCLVNRNHYKLL